METKQQKMKYNILTRDGFIEIKGEPITEMEKYGKYFIHKASNGDWVVDEYITGRAFCDGTTYKYAVERAINLIKAFGIEKINQQIEKSIKQYGAANK